MTAIASGGDVAGLLALTVLQVVLGVDNIVLLTILSSGLGEASRSKARRLGVIVAMLSRLLLLGGIVEIARADRPFGRLFGYPVSVKTVLLALGGLFLLYKATHEMVEDVERGGAKQSGKPGKSLGLVLVQIFVLDVVFSLDQVLAAVGMSSNVTIQVASVLLSVAIMLLFVTTLAKLLERHPSIRILALAFLAMVGVSLIAQASGNEFPKGYLYFGMAYALGVEVLNIRRRGNASRQDAKLSS